MPSARPSFARSALRAAGLSASLGALVLGGCYLADVGLPPPPNLPYFPTGLIVSPGRTTLYVANSDFDLQYNGGTIQAIDLTELHPLLGTLLDGLRAGGDTQTTCASVGLLPNPGTAGAVTEVDAGPPVPWSNQILDPGPCVAMDARPFSKSYAGIGAFASGALLVNGTTEQGVRLFVPVRGDPSITWIDINDDRTTPQLLPASCPQLSIDGGIPGPGGQPLCLGCGGTGSELRCDDDHRMGLNPDDNFRYLTLPTEPVGVAASEDGRALVVAHQTEAAVSLSINDWSPAHPSFQYYLSGLGAGPTEVAAVPVPAVVKATKDPAASPLPIAYDPEFLVTYNATPEVDLISFHDDQSDPPRPFLTRAGQFGVNVNADGKDSRGVVVDGSERKACEAACNPGQPATTADLACLRACTDLPLRVFIANRAPPSLLLGRIRTQIVDSDQGGGAVDTVEIYDSVSLAAGPSKVLLGNVIGPDGELHVRVFAVAFDSRFIFSYDPVAQRIDNIIRTGRGPQAIARDEGDDGDGRGLHSYLYVGHFTDSYIGVVNLDVRHPETFGTMFASIGHPIAPLESK